MMTEDMASWGWSSWLLFSVFLLVAFTFGFVLRDLIQQRRDKAPKKLEWEERFTLTKDNIPMFMGRFVSYHKEFNGATTLEAMDEHTIRARYMIPEEAFKKDG